MIKTAKLQGEYLDDDSRINLSKSDLNQLDTESVSTEIVVIDEHSTMEDVISTCELLCKNSPKVLGFDTETKPSFKKGLQNRVALLQLASKDVVAIFRLSKIENRDLLAPLENLLLSRRILKVGIGIADDVKGLYRYYELITNKILNLQDLARASNIGAQSLSKIYAILFGKRISKGQQLSDWERAELTESQKMYAALDAYAGYRIYMRLKSFAIKSMISDLNVKTKVKAK